MRKYELPLLATFRTDDERGRWSTMYVEPDFSGARVKRWGQVAAGVGTMVVAVEGDDSELDRIPADRRR